MKELTIILQKMLGVDADGVIGSQTLAAIPYTHTHTHTHTHSHTHCHCLPLKTSLFLRGQEEFWVDCSALPPRENGTMPLILMKISPFIPKPLLRMCFL